MAEPTTPPEPRRRRPSLRAKDRLLQPQSMATIRRILDGGREAFSQKGYHGVAIDDLVRAARVSRATFYLYFDGKTDLLRALAIDSLGVLGSLGPFPTDADDPAAAIRAWLEQMESVHAQYGAVWEAWRQEFGYDVVLHLLGQARLWQSGDALAAALRARGTERDPEVAALVVSAVQRNYFAYLPKKSEVSRDRALDTVSRILADGLVRSNGARITSG